MSWIRTRQKGKVEQIYCNPDIYGIGKFKSNEESNWWELPAIYSSELNAKNHLLQEQKKDPEWDYKVSYYE